MFVLDVKRGTMNHEPQLVFSLTQQPETSESTADVHNFKQGGNKKWKELSQPIRRAAERDQRRRFTTLRAFHRAGAERPPGAP